MGRELDQKRCLQIVQNRLKIQTTDLRDSAGNDPVHSQNIASRDITIRLLKTKDKQKILQIARWEKRKQIKTLLLKKQ